MHRLPPEIWQRVFIQLELTDRFSCALVCRSWWNVLDSTCLFYSITIRKNERKFIKFMDMLEQFPHRAAQVHELDLCDSIDEDFDRREICDIFPNARIINVAYEERNGSMRWPIEESEMKHSTSTVEVLKDSEYCQLTLQIINSNMGERLQKLDLNFHKKCGWFQVILSQLNNMPVLEELTLKSLIATVLNLEKLHTNLPTIKNLTLHNVRPCISAIPENITPATLTKLDYCSTFCENQVALPNWYQYMSIKYSNVTRIKYSDQNLQFIDMDVVQQMYENGFLQFLQLIGPSTPRHVLCKVPDGINVFEPLDNSGSKTKAFTFHDCQGGTLFEFLAQSNQARYVEEIKLYKTQIGTPDSLQSLTLLTQIDLNIDPTYHGTEIDFTSYLNGFPPSLERCDVKCSNLFVDPESTRSSRIKDLCIECEELTEALGDVLSNCFPNLVTLGLKADMPEHVVINIQSPDFKRATFINPMEQFEGCIFTVKSASQIEAYLWHSDSIKRMENVQDRGEPHITFTSAIQTESTVLGHNIQAILIAAFGSN